MYLQNLERIDQQNAEVKGCPQISGINNQEKCFQDEKEMNSNLVPSEQNSKTHYL